MKNGPALLPIGVMARRLFVSVKWLRGEATAGKIPHLKAGSRMLFDPKTVERVLLKRARQQEPEAEAGAK